ncbi:hypothetical protein [Nocardia asteroides]|uniref:hypothetical protein n=1 Tax=Nocardia asteroides TaxID=1824 RepID=UPI00344511B5
MTDTIPSPSPEQQRKQMRETLPDRIAAFLEADYYLMSIVHLAIEAGISPEEIRSELVSGGLAEDADRLLAAPPVLRDVERVLTAIGVVLHGPDDDVDLELDVASPFTRGALVVRHADGGASPSDPPDLEYMRQVAEVAVPALYDAGYQLALLDYHRVTPLDRDRALAEFTCSTDDFGVLVAESAV